MVDGINGDLQSGNEDRILSALYDLSGDERSFELDRDSMELIPEFLLSSNEDVVWRTIFFFGIVRPNPVLADYVLDVSKRWVVSAPHIVLSYIDSLARMVDVGVIDKGRCSGLISGLLEIPKLDLVRVFDLKDFCDSRISYRDYVNRGGV